MRTKNGFSLMEMMVVLLIMSIIAAATAPIVSRKMTRSAGSNASPWVFTGQGKNIAFNMGGWIMRPLLSERIKFLRVQKQDYT